MLKGVGEFFNPTKFRRMAKKVTRVFTQFFKDLGNPAKAEKAVANLLKSLQGIFFGMVDSQKGAMSKIIGGFKKIFKAIGQIILSAGKLGGRGHVFWLCHFCLLK